METAVKLAPARSSRWFLIKERGAIDLAGDLAVVDGHPGSGPETGPGEPSVLGDGIEGDVEVGGFCITPRKGILSCHATRAICKNPQLN